MDPNFKTAEIYQNETRVDSARVRYTIFFVLHIKRLQQTHVHVDLKRFR